ncbi:hypothetical protein [Virgibacillus pantothenticus]|nr:hypothetical protein [Virgibacillus pantothenticus]SIS68679.1 hypothetical protein SAMN05421787_102122 [Virgibacillus pantothenticus]
MLEKRMNGIFQTLDQINYALLHHYDEVLEINTKAVFNYRACPAA